MGIREVFANNLKKLRKTYNVTQESLADQLGISLKHLGQIERGIAYPSPEVFEKIADLLKVPPYILLYDKQWDNLKDQEFDKIKKMIDDVFNRASSEIKEELVRLVNEKEVEGKS